MTLTILGYEQPKIFSDKFNINVFNSLFDNHKQKYSSRNEQQVIKYQEPQALVISKNMNYSEIDVQNQRGNSFTRNIGNKNNIDYTDLKQAYTKTNLVDPRKVKTKQLLLALINDFFQTVLIFLLFLSFLIWLIYYLISPFFT